MPKPAPLHRRLLGRFPPLQHSFHVPPFPISREMGSLYLSLAVYFDQFAGVLGCERAVRVPVAVSVETNQISRALNNQGEPLTRLDGVVRLLEEEHDRLTRQIHRISAALSAFSASYRKSTRGQRKLSTAGRARIPEAQRLRRSKSKENAGPTKNGARGLTKRTISAAGKRRIAAAQKLRWARLKAA